MIHKSFTFNYIREKEICRIVEHCIKWIEKLERENEMVLGGLNGLLFLCLWNIMWALISKHLYAFLYTTRTFSSFEKLTTIQLESFSFFLKKKTRNLEIFFFLPLPASSLIRTIWAANMSSIKCTFLFSNYLLRIFVIWYFGAEILY